MPYFTELHKSPPLIARYSKYSYKGINILHVKEKPTHTKRFSHLCRVCGEYN